MSISGLGSLKDNIFFSDFKRIISLSDVHFCLGTVVFLITELDHFYVAPASA